MNFDITRGPKLCALLAVVAFVAAGCGTGGISAGKADKTNGKKLFVEKCGSCHTLADAGTQGKIGPNLDDAFFGPRSQGFAESTIRNVVHGQILYPVSNPSGVDVGVDLARVTFIDSSGLSVLVQARQRVDELGRRFEIRAASRPARRVLEISGLDATLGLRPEP